MCSYPTLPDEKLTSNIKNQGRKFLADTAHAKAVTLVRVVHVHIAAIEVHTVRVVSIVLRGRPIVSVRTGIVQRTGRIVVAVPYSGKLQYGDGNEQTFTKGDTGRVEPHDHSFD